MNIKHKLLISGLSVALVMLAGGLSVLYVHRQLELTQVLVAKQDFQGRVLIEADLLETIDVPKAYLSDDVYLKKADVTGKYVKINALIPKGSLIYKSSVETLDESIDYPALLLKEDQAVFAIDVNLSSTSGNTLQKGSKIDIYGTVKFNKETVVDLLFKQVRVVGIKDKNGNELNGKSNQLPKLLLIAFDQRYIPLLTKAIAVGNITLTPTAEFFKEEECILFEDSKLLEILYAQ